MPAAPATPQTVEDLTVILSEFISTIANIDITGSIADTVCLIYCAAYEAQARLDGSYAERYAA